MCPNIIPILFICCLLGVEHVTAVILAESLHNIARQAQYERTDDSLLVEDAGIVLAEEVVDDQAACGRLCLREPGCTAANMYSLAGQGVRCQLINASAAYTTVPSPGHSHIVLRDADVEYNSPDGGTVGGQNIQYSLNDFGFHLQPDDHTIRLEVKACSNAWMGVYESPGGAQTGTRAFGTMFGQAGNDCVIFRNHSSSQIVDYQCGLAPVLDCDQFTRFWVTWDGTHKRIGTGWDPLDPSSLLVTAPDYWGPTSPYRRIGMATVWGATGTWRFHVSGI